MVVVFVITYHDADMTRSLASRAPAREPPVATVSVTTGSWIKRAVDSDGVGSGSADEFLRRRLVLFGFVGFAFALFRVLVASIATSELPDQALAPDERASATWLTLMAAVIFFAVGALAKFVVCSPVGLRWIDGVGFVALAVAPAWTSWSLGVPGYIGFVPLLGLILIIIWRAAIVPSHPLRTAALSVVVAIWNQIPAAMFAAEEAGELMPVAARVSWLSVSIAIATTISHVIYSLRRRAQKAEQLGHYRLQGKIGGGGMGDVYLANHAMMCRPVAIKLLRSEVGDVSSIERFEREVRLTSALKHPNTITIYDFGKTPDGQFFYVMEYLTGRDLARVVADHGAFPPARAVAVLRQACASLGEAHRLNLIHRDVKPANIMLCEQGGIFDFAKVVDFGLVKRLGGPIETGITANASVLGTPLFLAPEAIHGNTEVDARSDIYGLGCVAWNLLTGQRLFESENLFEICRQHVETPAPPPSAYADQDISAELDAVVLRCLAKDPSERPQTMEELEMLLAEVPEADGWTAEHARMWWLEHPSVADVPDEATPESVYLAVESMHDRTMAIDRTDTSI